MIFYLLNFIKNLIYLFFKFNSDFNEFNWVVNSSILFLYEFNWLVNFKFFSFSKFKSFFNFIITSSLLLNSLFNSKLSSSFSNFSLLLLFGSSFLIKSMKVSEEN